MSEVLKKMREWHILRHRARTDLLWLCNYVLGYPDVNRKVHGPIMDALQKFPGADEFHKTEQDFAAALQGKLMWSPKVEMDKLPWNQGNVGRKSLIIFPRGHLKSTVGTIAHSVQWIINYPNVRILITTATENLGQDFCRQIKTHFLTNEKFRYLFPELCPPLRDGKVGDLGNLDGFFVPGRDENNKKLGPGGKDLTVKVSTVGSAITGYHGDVQKTDDAVEKINSSTEGGIDSVIFHFGTMEPLLDNYIAPAGGKPTKGWIDLIGTTWDLSDLYHVIREGEDRLPPERKTWNIVWKSAAPNWPNGPYLWPEMKGYAELKEIEDDSTQGPEALARQYLMNPIVSGQGLIDDASKIVWMPREHMDNIVPKLSLFAALDLAGMDENARGGDNDYTALIVGGFNTDGHLYIPFALHGRPNTEEVIEWVFDVFKRFPRLIKLKVEKEAHARVLLPFMKKEMARRQCFLSVDPQPRNNQQSKKDKIKGLRPWFMAGDIHFADDLPCKTYLLSEIKGFPKYRHDDLCDCLCDLMHEGKDINNAVMGREKTEYVPEYKKLADGTKVNIPQIPINTLNIEQIFGEVWGHTDIVNPFTGFKQ